MAKTPTLSIPFGCFVLSTTFALCKSRGIVDWSWWLIASPLLFLVATYYLITVVDVGVRSALEKAVITQEVLLLPDPEVVPPEADKTGEP
jgi:hypothetical protein